MVWLLIWPWPVAYALSMTGTMAASVVGFSFARFIARDWDPRLPPDQAAEISGAPVAWTGFGSKGVHPAKASK